MKKKVATKKSTVKKTVKRTIPQTSHLSSSNQNLLFRRIVIISACLVLFVGVTATFNRSSVRQAVDGMSVMAGFYNQTTVTLPYVPNAISYNIYYGQAGEQNFTNAVRNIPSTIHSYTISDLKKGVSYEYRYAAVDKSGKEFLFSAIKPIIYLQPM
jgi:hypothetical protein